VFVAKDKKGTSNPYLYYFSGQWVWGPKKSGAHLFTSEEEAIEKGRAAMPTLEMADRVVAEPA